MINSIGFLIILLHNTTGPTDSLVDPYSYWLNSCLCSLVFVLHHVSHLDGFFSRITGVATSSLPHNVFAAPFVDKDTSSINLVGSFSFMSPCLPSMALPWYTDTQSKECLLVQSSHSLEKCLNLEGFLEKTLKINLP